MSTNKPIRKLNKRLIYWCLIGLVSLSVPAIVSLASSKEKSSQTEQIKHNPQANINSKDGAIISGMEHFPENYAGVKEFEAEFASAKPKEVKIEDAFAILESKDAIKQPEQGSGGHHYGGGRDDPWREAFMREQQQRANDHYDSKRSDIMFIDNRRGKHQEGSDTEESDPTLKMLERTLAMAEKSMGHPDPGANELFFMKRGEKNEKIDGPRGFLGNGKGAGSLKDPAPFMISEGTLIHAILLSEINTDLPGPILARVSHNIWDSQTGKALLIPQNSKLIGEYNSTVGHGQSRAQIVWTRIIYPNQQSVDLARMVGVDAKGTSGTVGTVDNHYDKVAIGLFMSTALGAGVRMTQGKYDPNTASVSQELGNSLAQETGRLGNKIADKMLDIKPTITVPMGEKLNVFVETDLNLRPYEG
jgi:type IV secretory pathway VirB10-like protein